MFFLTLFFLLVIFLIFGLKPLLKFIKDVNWKLAFDRFDITRWLGKHYYNINFALTIILDIIVLACFDFKLSWSFWLILCLILTIIQAITFGKFMILKTRSNRYVADIAESTERSSVSSGVPRCGKTSSKNFTAVALAKKQWKRLQRDYWLCLNKPLEHLPNKLRRDRNEIIKAYNYAIAHIDKFIPCLFSFQTIWVGKRQSHPLTKKMLLQQAPIPYRAVLMADEIGFIFPNKRRKSEQDSSVDLDKLSDLCRFIGHYVDGYLLLTEQEFGKTFIDIRRVTGENIYFTKKQKWIMKPKFLSFVYEMFFTNYDYYLWKMSMSKPGSATFYKAQADLYKTSSKRAKFILWLRRLTLSVGFRRYEYRTLINTEVNKRNSAPEEVREGKFYLPAQLNCRYNDRVYRNLYECRNLDLLEPEIQDYYPTNEDLKERFSIYDSDTETGELPKNKNNTRKKKI